MSLMVRIDDLIEMGMSVLRASFDESAFNMWRDRAFTCLTALFGSDHAYTRYFDQYVRDAREMDLLTGGGILAAAREALSTTGNERTRPYFIRGSVP